jgi:2-keto-4-pentenoate hydratase/2-oxohepta-3-ene-1,7-dioic acid hydratase in catechol pathway
VRVSLVFSFSSQGLRFMKLASFRKPGDAAPKIGIVDVDAGEVFDLTATGGAAFRGMQDLIEAGAPALDEARRLVASRGGDPEFTHALAGLRLLAPVPVPVQMRDFSTFPGHIKNAPAGMARIAARLRGDEDAARAARPLDEIPAAYQAMPIYYITNRFSVIGTDAAVTWPAYSRLMDFEAEFGIFLSQGGKNISAANARAHIFGYTVYNDFSARDQQCLEMRGMLGPTKGKSFDAGNALGPWIVTADEIADPHDLTITARVNGALWATGNSGQMIFSFEEILAYVSRDETLFAGEFFGSGTIGNGCGLEQDRYLANGDVVEISVDGIGTLRNRVSA